MRFFLAVILIMFSLPAQAQMCEGFGNAMDELDGATSHIHQSVPPLAQVAERHASYTRSDQDDDGIPNEQDNCPLVLNPLQEDMNHNGFGDVCEPPGSPR